MSIDDDYAGKIAANLRVKARNFEQGAHSNDPASCNTAAIYYVGAALVELLGAIHVTLRMKL